MVTEHPVNMSVCYATYWFSALGLKPCLSPRWDIGSVTRPGIVDIQKHSWKYNIKKEHFFSKTLIQLFQLSLFLFPGYLCHTHTYTRTHAQCPQRPEIGFPGTRVTDTCQLPYRCQELTSIPPHILQKQIVFLPTEPSFYSIYHIHVHKHTFSYEFTVWSLLRQSYVLSDEVWDGKNCILEENPEERMMVSEERSCWVRRAWKVTKSSF